MTNTQTLIATRLRELRATAGLSQEATVEGIDNLSQETFSRIEKGARPINGDELIQLANRFGVRVSAISGLAQVCESAARPAEPRLRRCGEIA